MHGLYRVSMYTDSYFGGWLLGGGGGRGIVMTLKYNHTQHPLDNQSVIECYTIVIPIIYIMFLRDTTKIQHIIITKTIPYPPPPSLFECPLPTSLVGLLKIPLPVFV